jgi:hypothetical protein
MFNRNLILLVLGFVTVYDIITTISGTLEILQLSLGGVVAAVTLGLLIGGMLYYTHDIFLNKSEDFLPRAFKGLWALAFLYDIWTSFTGNAKFVLQENITRLNTDDWKRLILLLGLTLFVSSCPVILSYARNNERFMTGKIL